MVSGWFGSRLGRGALGSRWSAWSGGSMRRRRFRRRRSAAASSAEEKAKDLIGIKKLGLGFMDCDGGDSEWWLNTAVVVVMGRRRERRRKRVRVMAVVCGGERWE